MNRNTRMLVVVVIAVVAATLASVGVYIAVIRRPTVQVEVPSAYVVVAAKPLELGVSLTSSDVRTIAWPSRNPVAGSFAKPEDVVNRGLVAVVAENEPITENKLAPREAGAGLPPAIKPGMRAMSVKVNEVIGVAGFVVPGTKVDVLVTIHEDKQSITLTVVNNALVLTAGTRYDEAEAKKEGKAIASSVVTLMVTPADAERIALAATEGQLMLALRNPLDRDMTRTPLINTSELKGNPLVSPAPPRPRTAERDPVVKTGPSLAPPPFLPPPAPPRIARVETIKAGKVEEEIIR